MSKLLTLLIAVIVLVLLIKKLRRGHGRGEAPPGPGSAGRVERMVVCSYCGVHVPEGESVSAGGRVYCCEEHRRLGG